MKELKPPEKQTKICDNCRGNGYITVIDKQDKTNESLRQLPWQWLFKCGRQSKPHPGETMLDLRVRRGNKKL